MWGKMAAGAVGGFFLGKVVPPGEGLWVAAGVVAGYILDEWQHRRTQRAAEQASRQVRWL